MPTRLEALPVELCAHVALFLDRPEHSYNDPNDDSLLALRSVSRASLEAVRRAIKNHPRDRVVLHRSSGVQKITAVGQVLASGCRTLMYDFKSGTSPEVLNALQQCFVLETRGRLRELTIYGSSMNRQLLLEICSACPQLKYLSVNRRRVPNISQADMDDLQADMEDFAAALSRTCPLLEKVHIRTKMPWSPAETYARHFPNLKCLDLEAETTGPEYEPSRFDKIEASAHRCVGAEELRLSCCAVSDALAEQLLRTPLQSRIKSLYLNEAIISQPTLLQLVAGLEVLRKLVFPDSLPPHGAVPHFFTTLARARPSLKELHFYDQVASLDDACVAAICENFQLEALTIDKNFLLTPVVVDIILRSPTAQTLCSASFYLTPAFTSGGILRLARGCPRLAQLTWRVHGLTPLTDGIDNGKNVDDLTALLKERCRGHADWTFSVDHFSKFGPYPLAEAGWRYLPEIWSQGWY